MMSLKLWKIPVLYAYIIRGKVSERSNFLQYRSALEDYSKSLVVRNTQSLFTRLRGVKSSDYRASVL